MSKNPFDYRSFDHHLGNKRYRNMTQNEALIFHHPRVLKTDLAVLEKWVPPFCLGFGVLFHIMTF